MCSALGQENCVLDVSEKKEKKRMINFTTDTRAPGKVEEGWVWVWGRELKGHCI